MIGRLNHVAIAVRDIAQGGGGLSRDARRRGLGAGAAAGARRHHRVHHAAEHQDRAARAARRELADREIPRAQCRRRHPPRLLRGGRHHRGARPAQGARARACSATASRRSARTASRCCSCIRRISAARWSSSNRPEPRCRVTTGIAIYFLIWWIDAVRGAAVGRALAESDDGAPGTDPGAPRVPRLGRSSSGPRWWRRVIFARAACRLRQAAGHARRPRGAAGAAAVQASAQKKEQGQCPARMSSRSCPQPRYRLLVRGGGAVRALSSFPP